MPRYIDYKGWRYIRINRRIENLEWTMRFTVWIDLLQSRQEAGFVADFRGPVVVGMTPFPIRQDDSAGSQFPYPLRQRHASGHGVFEARVGKMQVLAMRDFEQCRRNVGFGNTVFGRSPRPHIARGQVDDSGAVACFRH